MQRALLLAALAAALSAAPAAHAAGLKKEAERKHAPDFELKDNSGRALKLSDLSGKVVLLDFWATWCAPCKAAMPWLSELAEKYRAQGLEVVGISMDEGGWEAVNPFLEKVPVKYPILLGTKRVGYLYGDVDALPLMFYIDRQQRVARIHLGAAGRKDCEKTIRTLLNLD